MCLSNPVIVQFVKHDESKRTDHHGSSSHKTLQHKLIADFPLQKKKKNIFHLVLMKDILNYSRIHKPPWKLWCDWSCHCHPTWFQREVVPLSHHTWFLIAQERQPEEKSQGRFSWMWLSKIASRANEDVNWEGTAMKTAKFEAFFPAFLTSHCNFSLTLRWVQDVLGMEKKTKCTNQ